MYNAYTIFFSICYSVPVSEAYVPCRSLSPDHRQWHVFLIVSVATPFVLAVPILMFRLVRRIQEKTNVNKEDQGITLDLSTYASLAVTSITSDLNPMGQLLVGKTEHYHNNAKN